jgi:aminoglycoside phosphotransferase
VKAAELIQNEAFADLFTATLSDFLTLRFGGNWKVSWTYSICREAVQSWIVNLNINAVFLRGVSRDALEIIKREFATSVVFWKRPFQRIYFYLATSATARLAAHAVILVEPSIPNACNCLIIPSTHKIRFVDATERIVYCHIKKGSSRAHFLAELDSREFAVNKGVPVPRVLERLSDDCIAEQMVIGTPLNRLTSRKQRAISLQHALDAIEPLYRSTARQVGFAGYAASLLSKMAAIAESFDAVVSTEAQDLAQRLGCEHEPIDQTVELVRCHGDFQPGNILHDQGKIWLIDWEYSCERQRQYDLLTYTLKVRFAKGLGKRIAAYADALADLTQLRLLRLFILESILYEFEALMVSTSHYVSQSLIARLAEFEKAMPSALRDCTA